MCKFSLDVMNGLYRLFVKKKKKKIGLKWPRLMIQVSCQVTVKSKSVTEFLLGRRANEWDSNKYEYKIHIFSPLCNSILRFLE